MSDPRAAAPGSGSWISDSRAYNLIWMGRWLERAEALARAVGLAVGETPRNGNARTAMTAALAAVADSWNVRYATGESVQPALGEYMLSCLKFARDDAEQVGPVELIRVLNAVLEEFPVAWAYATGPDQIRRAAEVLQGRLADVSMVIEGRWFRPIGH